MSSFASLLGTYVDKKTLTIPKKVNNSKKQSIIEVKQPIHDELNNIWENRCIEQNKDVKSIELIDKKDNGKEGGLGILLIIIDDLPHEAIWRILVEQYERMNINDNEDNIMKKEIRFWIHAKYPDRVSPWVRERLVKTFQLLPEWGSLDLTDVMFRLLKEASSDAPQMEKFIYASESCLPIMPFRDAFQNIFNDNCSWVNYRGTANDGYAQQQQFDVLKNRIPDQCIYKADQWILLSRQHAKEIIHLSEQISTISSVINIFKKVHASDEMFFPCLLSVLNLIPAKNSSKILSESEIKVHKKRITFCDWDGGQRNPETFPILNKELLIKANGSLCLRKIKGRKNKFEQDKFIKDWANLIFKFDQDKIKEDELTEIIDNVLELIENEKNNQRGRNFNRNSSNNNKNEKKIDRSRSRSREN